VIVADRIALKIGDGMAVPRSLAAALCFAAVFCLVAVGATASGSGHTSNWAVILSTSRYWFNYRHASDALSFYHVVRRCAAAETRTSAR